MIVHHVEYFSLVYIIYILCIYKAKATACVCYVVDKEILRTANAVCAFMSFLTVIISLS